MRRTFDSIPSMFAPSETRKRQRSWTCGSHAALPITVSPGASTAAMTVFSVAMTRASSRKMLRAAQAAGAHLEAVADLDLGAEPPNAWMCGSRRRRPMTSPPGGGTLTRPTRASSGPASRNDARIRLQSSWSSSCFATSAAYDAHLVRPGPFHVGADVGEQLDHRLDVADARDVRERDGPVGEQARRQDRQRAVLVSRGRTRP